MAEHKKSRSACHPIIGWAVSLATFVIVAEILIGHFSLAWALAIPITEHTTINLGEIPQWVIAAGVAIGIWRSLKAENKAAEAVVILGEVRRQTDGMVEKIGAMAKAEGKAEGKQQVRSEIAAEKEVVRTDAVADARAAAEIRIADASPTTENPAPTTKPV